MMKKILIALLVSLMVCSVAAAGQVKDNCGCGLGAMVLGDKDGLVWNILATTLNGTCGNQTFGITFGTLECEKPSKIAAIEQMNKFVARNMDNLAIDIAAGSGETLDALVEIAVVPAETHPDLYAALQENFDQIYPTSDVSNADVVEKIVTIIGQI
jgi:DUF3015 family protein